MKNLALLMAFGILSVAFTAATDPQTKKTGMKKARGTAAQETAGINFDIEVDAKTGKVLKAVEDKDKSGGMYRFVR